MRILPRSQRQTHEDLQQHTREVDLTDPKLEKLWNGIKERSERVVYGRGQEQKDGREVAILFQEGMLRPEAACLPPRNHIVGRVEVGGSLPIATEQKSGTSGLLKLVDRIAYSA
jgi:hypothetical protein